MCQLCGQAMNMLSAVYGPEVAEYLIWNETPFPFGGGPPELRTAWKLCEPWD